MGKTTLAKYILEKYFNSGRYFNWDFDEDRIAILKKRWKEDEELLVLDEIHKFPKWKQWVKGIYDVLGDRHCILITGSARLDVYRRGGDSLLGRYHYWRLHPFSLDELPDSVRRQDAIERLMSVGGFPEPFLSGDEKETRRWRRERFDRVIKYSDDNISRGLRYYSQKLKPLRATQIVATLKNSFDEKGVRVSGPLEYFDKPYSGS